MKIDVGCADIKLDGYIGVDAQAKNGVDYLCNLGREPLPFSNESVEEVYTSHFLEHQFPIYIPQILNEFHRVLIPSGTLRVIVPDVVKNILSLQEYENDMPRYIHVCESIYGGSVADGYGDVAFDSHKFIFTIKSLMWFCEQSGFVTDKCYSEPQGRGGDSIFYFGHKK